jgi:hypothetical protein
MVEPTLEEMLDEPIVRLVMERDGVKRLTVEALIRTLRPVRNKRLAMSEHRR